MQLFLTHLAKKNVKDVRKEIKNYGGFENALENYEKELQKKYEKIQKTTKYFNKKNR